MVFYTQPNEEWSDLDFKLTEAYQILQDETCPQCGNPIWLCRSTDNRVEWSVNKSVCYASKTVDESEWRASNPKKTPSKSDRERWGTSKYATPRLMPMYDGEDMPTRSDYYESLKEG